MANVEPAEALMEAIHVASQDKEVQKNSELMDLLIKSAKQLKSTNNYHQVAANLNKSLQYWGMGHVGGPAAIDTLYQATINDTHGRAYQKLPTGME
ncbi:hypothetical protein FD33_GL002315 [Companilactobacillus paralimentarius DSM 13238 = JCM 10415]|jgi:Enterocin A Immunity.|uniref:Bacteriocin immunity protein n=3 Tax=Companilactobacillus TaxID=2767879 RepID=A0A202FET6_9LACO|nr:MULTISPECIES: bacteriocin immunity protein [Companilactobacillus]KAE9560574.1 hypothetical protein ATN92_10545 [Companilactobacillus bobalius]KAE9564612.1 hypothetical protein ATN96_07720 [Companilactobacillus paralimentarius]KRK83346.1 hypothetical protein FC78_GL002157 [Companilactobacillus bobalius DSM 19674]KRL31100.1 hypothetical protein FD33_GL002315 [Companilactobacillus paralimentarius DSM 13238 = JCM 10415]MDR4934158.1 bacteriocin immunity protein [Companilactobacillus paralimentar